MKLRRVLLAATAMLLPIGAGANALAGSGNASAGTPRFDNSTDTVHCGAFFGKATINPALAVGGASPTSIALSGTLQGCTDGTGQISGSSSTQTAFSGKVSGTLSGATNNITTLLGCSTATGTLTVSWKGYYLGASPAEKLADATTSVGVTQIDGNLFAPGAPFGSNNVTTDGFGQFEIGANATAAGCTPPSSVSGGFLGTDNGATTASVAITSQDGTGILDGQTNKGSPPVTALLLGIGAYYGG